MSQPPQSKQDAATAPASSVRGSIRHWLCSQASLLRGPVLDVGSRLSGPQTQPWLVHRTMRADLEWLGVDRVAGDNVDLVVDLCRDTGGLAYCSFGGAVVAEVLEHADDPQLLLAYVHQLLMPGAVALVTVPSAVPAHSTKDYPDLWRYTRDGLGVLARRAGFRAVETYWFGEEQRFRYSDHGEPEVEMPMPRHAACVARKTTEPLRW